MSTIALIGNPNVGKTSLFNLLTNSNLKVGNWPGVTVERKESMISNDLKLVDLPGIYALDTYSNEEKISKDFIIKENPDLLLNIVDASTLERNLFLTLQLKQFKKPIVLVLNMMDVAKNKGMEIDIKKLEEKLNVKCVPIVASKETGIDELKTLLIKNKDLFRQPIDNNYQLKTEDDYYKFISEVLSDSIVKNKLKKETVSEKIDKIVLNKWLAYPVFLLALYIIFQFTFTWVGVPIQDLLDKLVNEDFLNFVSGLVANSSPWFQSLIIDGIIGGVGAIIPFLPIIVCLFLGLSLLEDCGYMARVAFIMDKLMRKIGLSGKAFIPMIMGFGCAVPGIMATRTLESEKDRKLSTLLIPLMSCPARLQVYALFVGIFFAQNQGIVVLSIYLVGIIVALLIGLIFKNSVFKKDEEPFMIELPTYKLPTWKTVVKILWEKSKGFLIKASTLIFAVSMLVWLISHFNFTGYVEDINQSFLASIGHALAPIFAPIGYGQWQAVVSLIIGIMAKEVVVATMGVVYAGDLAQMLPVHFSALSAISFMIFVSLYTPCVATIAAVKKEYGGKFAAFSVVYQFVLAWVVSFIVFTIGKIFI